MLRTVGLYLLPLHLDREDLFPIYWFGGCCCCSCAAHEAPWHFILHHHFHHKPSFPVRDHNITVNICCRAKLAPKVWSQAEEQQGHEAGSGLEAFHFLVTLHLPHFLKRAFLAIINNPRAGADAPFPCVQTARCPAHARIYIPTGLVVGHMSWVILARHVLLEGLCNTSAGSAAPWLTSPSHLLLSDAPDRGCTHRGRGWFSSASPRPFCSSMRGPGKQGWSHGVLLKLWVVLAVLSSSSSMVFGGSHCFHWEKRLTLVLFQSKWSKPLYGLKSSLLTKLISLRRAGIK